MVPNDKYKEKDMKKIRKRYYMKKIKPENSAKAKKNY